MRIRLFALPGLALLAAGCYVPPGTSLQNHYQTALPADVRVVHYYSDAYKDPQFFWVLTPIREDFLARIIAGAKLQPGPGDGSLGNVAPTGLPAWWDGDRISRLPELYYRDPGPTDGSYYRIWVDRPHNRIYILFMNT